MEEYYLQTPEGRLPIEPGVAEKYGLRPGALSPFTGFRVVDRDGRFPAPKTGRDDPVTQPERAPDEETGLENDVALDVSEMLDIARGADSD